MSEITLIADDSTIEAANRLAEENGTSVSAMFERFVKFLDARRNGSKNSKLPIGPITKSLTGVIELPEGIDYRDIVTEALMEKYGLSK